MTGKRVHTHDAHRSCQRRRPSCQRLFLAGRLGAPREMAPKKAKKVHVMVMVVNSALVRTHQSTYSGSFGPVLPPGWLSYTRSVAVPLDVEGLTRPPLAAQCPLRRPGVGVVLLSHCWLWGRGGWGRGACTAPVLPILGPSGGSPHPSPRSCAHPTC